MFSCFLALTIQEAAEHVGLTQSAIRYYDRKGLLPHVKRDKYNNRIFSEDDLIWIKLVKALRENDMPIEMVKEYVTLTAQGRQSLKTRFELMTTYQKQLEEKLDRDQANYITINRWINHFIKVLNDNDLSEFPKNVDKNFPESIKKTLRFDEDK